MAVENFVAYNPVKLHFGENVVKNLGKSVKQYGNRVLLIYGRGSVKKYGYYDEVVNQLKDAGLSIFEYSGIKPNPVVDDVRNAVAYGKENKVDVIVALGGGSVIDSAKIIGLGLASDVDPWDFMTWNVLPEKTMPLVTVLTLAATGTEMNAAAVLQNAETHQKVGLVHPMNFPKESFLDPRFTVTVPKDYTAYGIVDLIAHALEAFFGEGEPSVIDLITTDIIKDAMKWAPQLMNDPENLELRSNIMLDATLALNGLTSYGKVGGDWGVHGLGHELSYLYDLAHGATLSIAYPAWLRLQKERIPERIQRMGKLIFGTEDPDEAIKMLEEFFTSISSPVRLSEAGVESEKREEVINQMNVNNVSGMHHTLSMADRTMLIDLML
ncbi:MAG: iron-containing alcohol dehydrogenase [Bacteroidales bacterium]|nr:iron-containing alcohol dehydrogenase [Bacteroidales bacterium]